jgi:hypothetical protein
MPYDALEQHSPFARPRRRHWPALPQNSVCSAPSLPLLWRRPRARFAVELLPSTPAANTDFTATSCQA